MNKRHSYVRFFPSDWMGGTARMPRLHRSVYHDICVYNWDKGEAVPKGELALMVADLPNGMEIVETLVEAGKLLRGADGSVANPRAMDEAALAFGLWEKKSKGGKAGADKTNKRGTPDGTPAKSKAKKPATPAAEPEPEPEPEDSPSGESVSRARKTLIPDDFEPPTFGPKTACGRIMAGWDEDQLEHQVELFKAYHQAKGSFMVEWKDAWKTWVLNSKTFGRQNNGSWQSNEDRKSLVNIANELIADHAAMDERQERQRASSNGDARNTQLALEGPRGSREET